MRRESSISVTSTKKIQIQFSKPNVVKNEITNSGKLFASFFQDDISEILNHKLIFSNSPLDTEKQDAKPRLSLREKIPEEPEQDSLHLQVDTPNYIEKENIDYKETILEMSYDKKIINISHLVRKLL